MNNKEPIRVREERNKESRVNDVHVPVKHYITLNKKRAPAVKKSGSLFLQNSTIRSSSNSSNGNQRKENSLENIKERNATQQNKKGLGENSRISNKRKGGNVGDHFSSIATNEGNILNKRKSIRQQNEIIRRSRNPLDDDIVMKKFNEMTNLNEINECIHANNVREQEPKKGFRGRGNTTGTATSTSSIEGLITGRPINWGRKGKTIISSRSENRNDGNSINANGSKNVVDNDGVQTKGGRSDTNSSLGRGNSNVGTRHAMKGKRKSYLSTMGEYPLTSKNIYDSIYIPQINIHNIINSDTSNNTNNRNAKRRETNTVLNNLNAFSNVRVAVRIRPIEEPNESIVSIFNKKYVLIEKENEKESYLLSQKKKQSTYVFDVVFDVTASQEEVFQETAKPLIPHVFEGINCTVFAYGATGSGKTYTMLDDKNHNGIVQLSLLELFTLIKRKNCKSIKVVVSFLEVYNETIRDLLERDKKKPLEVQEDVAEVKVNNLCEREVHSYEEAMALITEGVKNRKMSPTRANKVSSRSHAILQIYVSNEILDEHMNIVTYKAKLCFVDLAGSERASATSNKGERFKEGSFINQSLLALANCINSLASNKSVSKVRVKYRDSKLTHLLKNSLEGNCLVVMIANINPSRKSFQESNNTLKYAFRARNIKLCATAHTSDNKESELEKILKKSETLQKEYNELLTKYKNLKTTFSDLSELFKFYKSALLCYQEKENSMDNLHVLELKEKICLHEQLIKVQLEKLKKKVTDFSYEDEHNFFSILDSVPNTNLHILPNTTCSILNEIENQVPVDNIFIHSTNANNQNYSLSQNSNYVQSAGHHVQHIQNNNRDYLNNQSFENKHGSGGDDGRDVYLGGFHMEQTAVGNTPFLAVSSNIPLSTVGSCNHVTCPIKEPSRELTNVLIDKETTNSRSVPILKNDTLHVAKNSNEDETQKQNMSADVNRESAVVTDKENERKRNNGNSEENITNETKTYMKTYKEEFSKMKSGKNWQTKYHTHEKIGSKSKNNDGVGRNTCFLNRKKGIITNGIQHEIVVNKGGNAESIIIINDDDEKITNKDKVKGVVVEKENMGQKLKKVEKNSKETKKKEKRIEEEQELMRGGLVGEVTKCEKTALVDNEKEQKDGTMKFIEHVTGIKNVEDVDVVEKPEPSDQVHDGTVISEHTDQLCDTDTLRKKNSSNSSSLSGKSIVNTKSKKIAANVMRHSYDKESVKHIEDIKENKRKFSLDNNVNTKHEYKEVIILKPKKRRMES